MVSIGISTYNRANTYLREALESAINQTYSNIDIIVSDNCSTDHTEALVNEFTDPRIRYFRQPRNIGPNDNFNFCLEHARGTYFLLLHDDDHIDFDMVETCLRNDPSDDVALVRTGVRVVDDQGDVISQRYNRANNSSTADFYLSYFTGSTAIYFCNTLFRTALLRKTGGFHSPHNLLQDGTAIVRIMQLGASREIPDVKASFRRHGSNRGSSVRIREWCEDSMFLLDLMAQSAGAKVDEVRQRGLQFFTRQNYNRLYKGGIRSPGAYLKIFNQFGKTYSPLSFLSDRILERSIKRMRRVSRVGMGKIS